MDQPFYEVPTKRLSYSFFFSRDARSYSSLFWKVKKKNFRQCNKMGGLFEQFGVAACWWIGGRRYDGGRNSGVGLRSSLHLHLGLGKIGFFLFLFSGQLHMGRNHNTFLFRNPDELSRPRTGKSRLGRWRKFPFVQCLSVFFSFCPFPSVNSSKCVSRLHILSSSNFV